jgi:predicted Fe-S protein YdhL (DUF1289 family)
MRLTSKARQEAIWFINLSNEQRQAVLAKCTPQQRSILSRNIQLYQQERPQVQANEKGNRLMRSGEELQKLGKGLFQIGLGITTIMVIIVLVVLMAGCVFLMLASHSMVMLPMLI